jgi:ABC-type uncharacterized transport system auxiliary subunit
MKTITAMKRRNCEVGGVSMRAKTAVIFLALAAVAMGGCAAVPATKFYQLTVPGDMGAGGQGNGIAVTLLVGPIGGSHVYRDDRLIYGNGSEELGAYEYERWVEPPVEMIQEMLLRELRMSGRYRGVYTLGSAAHGDYVLRGNLYDFKEVSGNPLSARVTLDLELRDTKGGTDVWTHHYTHDEPVNGKDVAAVVSALDRNVQEGIREALASLDQYLAAHPTS